MEGKYLLFEDEVSENKHFHTFFKLDNGSTLVYQDVRKFGTMDLLDKEQVADYFCQENLVPEPTENDFDLATFAKQLKASKGHKALFIGPDLGCWAWQYLCG